MIRRLTGFVLLSSLLLVPSFALGQDQQAQAREAFGRGVELYEAGNHQPALEAFQRAYNLAPHPTVRVNIANCYEHLDRPIEALHYFDLFLEEAENPSGQQRREVQTAIRRLQRLVGTVRLNVHPDGATIVIDNDETRRSPVLQPIRMTQGVHHITVRMDGYRTENRELTVDGGDTQRVRISLTEGTDPVMASNVGDSGETGDTGSLGDPDADPGGGTDDTGETGDSSSGDVGAEPEDTYVDDGGGGGWRFRATLPWIIPAAAAGALGITTLITGIVALSANDDFEAAVARARVTTGAVQAQARLDGLAAADLANTMSIVTDIFLIGTIAAAGLAVALFIIEGLSGDEDEMVDRDPEGLRLVTAPMLSPDSAGWMLGASF